MSQVEALPPERIWLQWYGDGSPDDIGDVSVADVTWERDKIFEHDIEYVRADTLSQPNHEMKRCAKCGNLFRYPPSDNKPDATTCAWCSQPNQKCALCKHDESWLNPTYKRCMFGFIPPDISPGCGCRCEFPNQQAAEQDQGKAETAPSPPDVVVPKDSSESADPWTRFRALISIANSRPCPSCGHRDVASDGLCADSVPLINKEPHGGKRCQCPCVNFAIDELDSDPKSFSDEAALEAAKEIASEYKELLLTQSHYMHSKVPESTIQEIAAIISKHLSRGADQTDQGEMKAKNSGGVAAESLLTALAGRELDAAVAERVMGREILYQAGNISKRANEDGTHAEMWVGHPTTLEQCRKDCAEWNSGMTMRLSPMVKGNPAYSTSIAAAMEVVEKLGVEFTLGWLPSDDSGINWDASFGQDRDSEGGTCVYAETAPLAICRAALMYVEKHST